MGYSVILPTLNEAGHIIKLIENIRSIFSEIQEEFEIILIDDNSTDGTVDIIKKIAKNYENIQFFLRKGLKKNLANSINLGIQKSKYENIIWMDADFQHPPDHFKLFYDYQNKYDLVIFSRFLKNSIRYFKDEKYKKEINENQSVFFNKLCNFFLYRDITDYTSGFICIKRKILEKAHQGGLKIVAGTDAGVPYVPFGNLADEINGKGLSGGDVTLEYNYLRSVAGSYKNVYIDRNSELYFGPVVPNDGKLYKNNVQVKTALLTPIDDDNETLGQDISSEQLIRNRFTYEIAGISPNRTEIKVRLKDSLKDNSYYSFHLEYFQN